MTSSPEMLIKKRINFLCFFDYKQVESNTLNNWKLKTLKIIDERVFTLITLIFSLLPKLSFRYLKQCIQEFHRKYVLAPADKAANNVVVV